VPGLRVLVAENNEKSMKLFRDVLRMSGYDTLGATSGERAVELAVRYMPDLVLMDIQLSGADGLSALRRLRAEERTAAIPIVAVTAQAMAGDRERLLEAGFDGYLSKPVNVPELIAVVKRHCGGRGTADATGSP
jgi:two-component system cell cycle response regulator DivK